MFQNPRPIGPTTNTAAPFSPEMAQGSRPERGVRFTRQLGWVSGQTTHVAATFGPEMIQGARPQTHRIISTPLRRGWLAQTPDIPSFSIEMVIGSRPDRPRILLGARIPLPLSQTTHVQAPFSPDMIAGAHPDRHRIVETPRRAVWTFVPPDVQPFSIEMVAGCKPDRGVNFVRQLGWVSSQTTHVSAPFTPDMSQGSAPPRFRAITTPVRTWHIWLTPDIPVFSIEMVAGSKPDRPRIFLGPRIPLPVSQTTHTAAAFGPEMSQGSVSGLPRIIRTPVKLGFLAQTPDILIFSIEMVAGSAPDRGFRFTRQLGLSQAQTSHVSAPFTPDMVQGAKPPEKLVASRTTVRQGWIAIAPDFVALVLHSPSLSLIGSSEPSVSINGSFKPSVSLRGSLG